MPYLYREEAVFVLNLGESGQSDTENRMSSAWMEEINHCLDEVEAFSGPAALVTTGTGKFYSNGFVPEQFLRGGEEVTRYLVAAQELFIRMLSLPLPTVAALQGHAYAGGAIFAMVHDQRVMRTDRGFFCLPEINLRLPLPGGLAFPKGAIELLLARLPPQTAHEAMLTGRRYGGEDALAAGIVDAVTAQEDVLSRAHASAAALVNTRSPVLGAMKRWIYRDVIDRLRVFD